MSAVHKHHRKRRAQGGDDSPANIIELEPWVHEAVHRNVALALEYSLLVPSWADPDDTVADVPGFLAALGGRIPVGTGSDQGTEEPMQTTVDGDEVPHRHVVTSSGVKKPCPKCKGKGEVIEEEKDPDQPQAPERKKVTWSVRVPKDERENGYEVLDALVDACVDRMVALGLIRDKNKGANYYTLVAALRKFAVGEDD